MVIHTLALLVILLLLAYVWVVIPFADTLWSQRRGCRPVVPITSSGFCSRKRSRRRRSTAYYRWRYRRVWMMWVMWLLREAGTSRCGTIEIQRPDLWWTCSSTKPIGSVDRTRCATFCLRRHTRRLRAIVGIGNPSLKWWWLCIQWALRLLYRWRGWWRKILGSMVKHWSNVLTLW